MLYKRYYSIGAFKTAALDILLENEAQNNLILSLMTSRGSRNASDWLLATITGNEGVALTALCIKPFGLLLYETGNIQSEDSVMLLARELHKAGFAPPGVMAERGLARRFAKAYSPDGGYALHMPMTAMRLDNLRENKKAPGFSRLLDIRDMSFAPDWERAFNEDCRAHVFTRRETVERLKARIIGGTHYLWIDEIPVSQAVHGRSTPGSAIITGVYTPPEYRGRGYATSIVAELSKTLLESGCGFCCLFADADNQTSCGIYRRLGYYDVCDFEDIRFDIQPEMH